LKTIRQSIFYKLETYTLNPDHPRGRDKAKWFDRVLGFTLNNKEELAQQIIFDQKTAVALENNQFGQMYLQYVTIHGANDRIIKDVRTYWIKEKETSLIRFTNILPPKFKVLK
jgi:hypothetical protein